MTASELAALRREIESLTAAAVRNAVDPIEVVCQLSVGADPSEVARSFPDRVMPADLVEWWSLSRDSYLFRDLEYDQWGLHIHSPSAAKEATEAARRLNPDNIATDDVVIGTFLGDGELVVVSLGDGSARVALEIDPRVDWPVFRNTQEFLEKWVHSFGNKFWAG